jgi:hypothetical protein
MDSFQEGTTSVHNNTDFEPNLGLDIDGTADHSRDTIEVRRLESIKYHPSKLLLYRDRGETKR